MGTIYIKNFTGGLDARRLPEMTEPGYLIRGVNGHITAGSEFEKRAAVVSAYTLPSGTIGLWYDRSSLVVFGSEVAPSMPTGVSYQRLQHSDGTTALTEVLSAELYKGKIYAVGLFADGSILHFYDGARVDDWFDGRARASFEITAGVATPSVSEISDIKVDGVSIIAAPVLWATSNADMAQDVANAINSHTSSPEYTATAVGARVNIIADTPGTASNGLGVTITTANGLVIDPTSGLSLANGAASTNSYQPGSFVKTIGSKVYSLSGENMHFSGIAAPTQWTSDATGAGLVDMSSISSGLEELIAIAKYQGYISIFAEKTTQIHYVDPDPELIRPVQTLENTGTKYPNSVAKFGDNDLFYVDAGVRSLQARDSSNAATTTDIGVPIDTLIREKLAELDEDETRKVIGVIEPTESRFWLAIKDVIFVFSFFNGAKVSAWTTYELDFEIEQMVVFGSRVYMRSGDTIHVYGGLTSSLTYDDTVAEAWLPYLDANDPTRAKSWQGIDAALEGLWVVSAGMEPTDLDAEDEVARLHETTFNLPKIGQLGSSTHISLRFRSSGEGPRKLSAAVIHYDGGADED